MIKNLSENSESLSRFYDFHDNMLVIGKEMHDPNATKGFQDIHITSKFIETNYDIFLDFCYESFNVIFAW